MKKIISAVLVILVVLCMLLPAGCGSNKEKVLIYASSEEYRLEDLRARLKEEFPQYNCVVEYKDTARMPQRSWQKGRTRLVIFPMSWNMAI